MSLNFKLFYIRDQNLLSNIFIGEPSLGKFFFPSSSLIKLVSYQPRSLTAGVDLSKTLLVKEAQSISVASTLGIFQN